MDNATCEPFEAQSEHTLTGEHIAKKRKLSSNSATNIEVGSSEVRFANQGPIKAHDPSKPCHFAKLPAELRVMIYKVMVEDDRRETECQVSEDDDLESYGEEDEDDEEETEEDDDEEEEDGGGEEERYNSEVLEWPEHHEAPEELFPYAFMHVCRATRPEAAEVYYTQAQFEFTVKEFDFRYICQFLDTLPRPFQNFFNRNPNVTIFMDLDVKQDPYISFGTSPDSPEERLGGLLRAARLTKPKWNCDKFGDIRDGRVPLHQGHFADFCLLANWWIQFRDALYQEICWKYDFNWKPKNYGPFMSPGRSKSTLQAQRSRLIRVLWRIHQSLTCKCVPMIWSRNRDAMTLIQREATKLLKDMETWWYQNLGTPAERSKYWTEITNEVYTAIERWDSIEAGPLPDLIPHFTPFY